MAEKSYKGKIKYFSVVNGAGGDGGVEAYAELKNGDVIAVQSKWFLSGLKSSQISQIRKSVKTAKEIRPHIKKYIVCIPRDLASKKIVKGGQKETEEDRWNNFINEMKSSFPDLDIQLWNDHRIKAELQFSESEGIHRVWFEKEEFSVENLKFHYKKAKESWLSQRYIPSLHGKGKIAKEVEKLLSTPGVREDRFQKLVQIKEDIDSAAEEINWYLENFSNKELSSVLIKLKTPLKVMQRDYVAVLSEAFIHGFIPENFCILEEDLNLYDAIRLLEKNPLGKNFWYQGYDLKKALEKLDSHDITDALNTMCDELLRERAGKIIVGNPGTGKTHGLADLVETRLIKKGCPAVLIQAKSISPLLNWGEIIKKEIGLSGNWSEMEIWAALEALSYRCDVTRTTKGKEAKNVENEPTKVLICIDGIDEAENWDKWIERIGELKAVTERFPRLRFVIFSRPPAFKEEQKKLLLAQNLNFIYLRDDGDKPVSELFESYISHFKINIDDAKWLKWTLRTPFSLKLFCDLYKNKRVNPEINVTISELLKKKIDKMDEEIARALGNIWSSNENVILKGLLRL